MPRPTKNEIDAEIIDRAAGLFAKHGFENTSLQQIADAVRYSKAGLLHHYPSKNAIYEAVFSTCLDSMQMMLASVEGLPPGMARDKAVVEYSVDFTYDWPGVSAFANRVAGNEEDVDPRLTEMGLVIYRALGTDLANATLERIVRITSALSGLGITAMLAARMNLRREWREDIVSAAMNALGHTSKRKPKPKPAPQLAPKPAAS